MSQVHVRKKLGGNAVKSNEILKKIRWQVVSSASEHLPQGEKEIGQICALCNTRKNIRHNRVELNDKLTRAVSGRTQRRSIVICKGLREFVV